MRNVLISLNKVVKNDLYDSKGVVLRRNNLIDTHSNGSTSLDTMARISILSQSHKGLNNLTQEELYEQISLIPDKQVQEYLSNLNSTLNTTLPRQEALIVEISDFFTGLGLKVEEAQQITRHLVSSLLVKRLSDLKSISDENFNQVFLQVNSNFNISHPNFLDKVKVYFDKI
jgi:hypothetical protein